MGGHLAQVCSHHTRSEPPGWGLEVRSGVRAQVTWWAGLLRPEVTECKATASSSVGGGETLNSQPSRPPPQAGDEWNALPTR